MVFIILTAVFVVSCTNDETDDEPLQQTTAEEVLDDNNDKAVSDPTNNIDQPQRIPPGLPGINWGGHIFKILTDTHAGRVWTIRDIMSEEQTGDPINDAVYLRNLYLEARYNFTVEQLFPGEGIENNAMNMLRRAAAAGDSYFDAVSVSLIQAARMAQEGLLLDLFDVHYIDFEKPWWDQNAVEGISVGNRLFFASGDFSVANKDALTAFLFNKQLIKDLDLTDPYELVRDGLWNWTEVYEMARTGAADLNGNGLMEWDIDRFGLVPGEYSMFWPVMHGSGVRVTAKDSDDLPFLVYSNETTWTAGNVYLEFHQADFTGGNPSIVSLDDDDNTAETTFSENRGLFLIGYMRSVENLRGMDTDFGILPMPRLNENQQIWGHSIDTFHGQGIAVPAFHDLNTADRAGFMLEALSAESMYTVIPAYYDVQLTGKLTRDDESSEMLDIIFGSVVWDTGYIYDWFGLWGGGPGTYTYASASSYERQLGRIEAAMQAAVDVFADLE